MDLYTKDIKENGLVIEYYLDEGDNIIEQCIFQKQNIISFFSWDKILPLERSQNTIAIFRITKLK
jgi:hypothetical protein